MMKVPGFQEFRAADAGAGHVVRVQDDVQLLAGQHAAFEHDLADGASGQGGFTGEAGRRFIPDVRVDGSHDAHTAFHVLAHDVRVGIQVFQQVLAEHREHAVHHGDALQQVEDQHGFHDVQLELPGLGGQADGQVVSGHLKRHLIHDLGHDGVDLAGHDAAARLPRRQLQFTQASAGAGRHQAQVVGDLAHVQHADLQGGTHGGVRVGVLRGVDQVWGRRDGMPAQLGEVLHDAPDVLRVGVQAGAHGGRAHIHFGQVLPCRRDAPHVTAQHAAVSLELLA